MPTMPVINNFPPHTATVNEQLPPTQPTRPSFPPPACLLWKESIWRLPCVSPIHPCRPSQTTASCHHQHPRTNHPFLLTRLILFRLLPDYLLSSNGTQCLLHVAPQCHPHPISQSLFHSLTTWELCPTTLCPVNHHANERVGWIKGR